MKTLSLHSQLLQPSQYREGNEVTMEEDIGY